MSSVRLQKFISDCGVTSRRKAELLILSDRVQVNGKVENVLGTKIDPAVDIISLDGKNLNLDSVQKVYLLLNKPRGYITSLSDPEGRETIMTLCKNVPERIYPVGRLDYLSEGLLILTNDGELANMVMHPKHEIHKVYEVKVFGIISDSILSTLRSGVQLEDGFAKPKSVRILKQFQGRTLLEFKLCEGRNREIRRICDTLSITIDTLKRIAIERLSIDGVEPGHFRYISKKEIYDSLGLK